MIENLIKRFEDVTALDGLTLEIRPGELFGLLGPNGAGKTTLINILAGLIDPTEGSVSVAGFSMPSQSGEVKGLIGVCPQDTAVYDYLTGRENVELFGALHTRSSEDVRRNADDLLDRLSLSGDSDRRVGKFSGGMRRRINLIMALIHDPQIAFLDEPTVAMDPQSRRAVWDFIR
ncbi:MAG: ABC transporter ATP-binding protein, partial [Theionarchaea archaeon]|nr:ABC transporter ATP-binding protein [Theionarchaea archaeon]